MATARVTLFRSVDLEARPPLCTSSLHSTSPLTHLKMSGLPALRGLSDMT